jgi:hypothetical protein
MAQMRGQMNGPSIAGMQGQRAMAQSGQQALMQGAMGNGRAAMLQSQGVAGGIAGDTGQARLAEVMRAQAGIGGAAGSLRGNDLQSAEANARAALAAQMQTAGRGKYALSAGSALGTTEMNNALENYKFGKRVEGDVNNRQAGARDQVLDTAKTFFSMLASMGG